MAMRFFWLPMLVALLILAGRPGRAEADVGQCWVLFVYAEKGQLNAEQQQEIGRRLTQAHMNSSGSDRHVSFVCYLDPTEADVVYRITRRDGPVGNWVEGYMITATDFAAMREAVKQVEQDCQKKGGPLPADRKQTKTP